MADGVTNVMANLGHTPSQEHPVVSLKGVAAWPFEVGSGLNFAVGGTVEPVDPLEGPGAKLIFDSLDGVFGLSADPEIKSGHARLNRLRNKVVSLQLEFVGVHNEKTALYAQVGQLQKKLGKKEDLVITLATLSDTFREERDQARAAMAELMDQLEAWHDSTKQCTKSHYQLLAYTIKKVEAKKWLTQTE